MTYVIIDILLAGIVLWSAHWAGVHYERSRAEPKHRQHGIMWTIVAVVSMAVLVVGQLARS